MTSGIPTIFRVVLEVHSGTIFVICAVMGKTKKEGEKEVK